MLRSLALFACFLVAQLINAQISTSIPLWGQCGGVGFLYESAPPNLKPKCDSPGQCYYISACYSQCIPPWYPRPTLSQTTSACTATTTRATQTTTKILPRATGIDDCPISVWTYALVSGPTPHLRVGKLASGAASLDGKSIGTSYGFTYNTTGGYFSVSPECSPITSASYLTVDELYPASYKPLVWTSTKHTNYWFVGAGGVAARLAARAQGGTLSTTATSPFGIKSSFLACGNKQQLYLQTGSDIPVGLSCQSVYLNIEVYA